MTEQEIEDYVNDSYTWEHAPKWAMFHTTDDAGATFWSHQPIWRDFHWCQDIDKPETQFSWYNIGDYPKTIFVGPRHTVNTEVEQETPP